MDNITNRNQYQRLSTISRENSHGQKDKKSKFVLENEYAVIGGGKHEEYDTLMTDGIQSCFALTLHDPKKKISGLGHFSTPFQAESGVRSMIKRFTDRGSDIRDIVSTVHGNTSESFTMIHGIPISNHVIKMRIKKSVEGYDERTLYQKLAPKCIGGVDKIQTKKAIPNLQNFDTSRLTINKNTGNTALTDSSSDAVTVCIENAQNENELSKNRLSRFRSSIQQQQLALSNAFTDDQNSRSPSR